VPSLELKKKNVKIKNLKIITPIPNPKVLCRRRLQVIRFSAGVVLQILI
jgi:hypothetical protein